MNGHSDDGSDSGISDDLGSGFSPGNASSGDHVSVAGTEISFSVQYSDILAENEELQGQLDAMQVQDAEKSKKIESLEMENNELKQKCFDLERSREQMLKRLQLELLPLLTVREQPQRLSNSCTIGSSISVVEPVDDESIVVSRRKRMMNFSSSVIADSISKGQQQQFKRQKRNNESIEFQVRQISALYCFDSVKAHDLVVECNRLSYPGETRKYSDSHMTAESKTKHLKEVIYTMISKAKIYSAENAENLVTMLADTSGNWVGHIYYPWKCNNGAKDARNRKQKMYFPFHSRTWTPEAFLKVVKQGIKIRLQVHAMDRLCDANNDGGYCINPFHYAPKPAGFFE